MNKRFLLTTVVFAFFSSATFSASVQELEQRMATIEAVLAQIDADGDSFAPQDGDCDDSNPETHPKSREHKFGDDDKDNDCDGIVDEDDYYELDSDLDTDL